MTKQELLLLKLVQSVVTPKSTPPEATAFSQLPWTENPPSMVNEIGSICHTVFAFSYCEVARTNYDVRGKMSSCKMCFFDWDCLRKAVIWLFLMAGPADNYVFVKSVRWKPWAQTFNGLVLSPWFEWMTRMPYNCKSNLINWIKQPSISNKNSQRMRKECKLSCAIT